jgi:CBS domain-containing protein
LLVVRTKIAITSCGCMSLKVEDVMVKEVITVDEQSIVKEAVDIMNKFEIGCLIVTKNGKAGGILTERDLLKRIVGEARDPAKTRVVDVMSKPLIVVEPDMEMEEAAKLMFKLKIKKLPVVQEGQLLGLVTLTDLARFQPQMIRILKKMSEQMAPRRIKKVVDYYVV